MRLIDADLAQQIADKELNISDAEIVQYILSHTPTIEAEPVRHGKWIYEPSDGAWTSTCSVCKTETNEDRRGMKFCPNCGIRMDGE